MRPSSFYKLLITCLFSLAVAIGVWVATPDYSAGHFFGRPFFPGLLEKVNDVDVMSVEHEGTTMTFIRDASGNWSLMEADSYPADKERIRNVLIGLANLEKIEPKTALPEFYPDLGVEDNTRPGSKSYLVTLMTVEGKQLLSLLVGRSTRGISWNGTGYFVRRPEESQSWLARGSMDITGDSRSWLNTRILPLVKGRASSVTIIDGSKKREAIYKRVSPRTRLDATFLSDPYFLISEEYTEEMEKALTSFDFAEVSARTADIGDESPFTSAFIETFDGLNIYVFFYLINDKPSAAVSFSAADNAPEDVKKEAERLEQQHSPWLYVMPGDKVSAILPFLAAPEKTPPRAEPKKKPEPVKKAAPAKKILPIKKIAPAKKAAPAKTAVPAKKPAAAKKAPVKPAEQKQEKKAVPPAPDKPVLTEKAAAKEETTNQKNAAGTQQSAGKKTDEKPAVPAPDKAVPAEKTEIKEEETAKKETAEKLPETSGNPAKEETTQPQEQTPASPRQE